MAAIGSGPSFIRLRKAMKIVMKAAMYNAFL